ncbi:hypothetical protein PLESTB_001749400 [Pleodorina starrii]|uniref:PHD-type domain-containing protein n=1 Tax=Pleodorina starrii TaxID=330485 RepID=A0A9W6C0V9_9CHLO|nr:hypothetical protein PLESTM_000710500 [Pleodorina starrii]GLC61375.1 hypothetical protein PLESTB_001749400 [Pleodorina starrii]GLC67546.1 hypothetical protein PLESTF_000569100 [Pleodorina starrii]
MPVRAKARQAGLALVSDLSEESLGSFLLKASKKPKAGVEGVAELTRQQLLDVCSALGRLVEQALPAAIGGGDTGLEEDVPPCRDAVLKLHGAAVLSLELLARSQQSPPEQLLNVAIMLHDGVLISTLHPALQKLQVEMQDAVARLCCAWWERQLPGNDMLVARTIPYVLLRAVQSLDHSRTSMVHACYVIRDALELLDFDDETIDDTKRMLLLAAMHPAFLREAEGRRFIAGLFRLQPQLTCELCAIVRNQIPSGQRFALEAYGDILFRAWRDTVGPCAAEVEAELQSLMQAAIQASTPALAAALRAVLDGLHSQKSLEKRLNPTLVRLYDPILPRAFAAANAEVRRNAVNLLVAAFPIIDPEAPAEENNTRLTQQLALLIDTLADPCPAVREAGVEGCCRCLKFFWEIIPAATSAKIISEMTSKLAFDGSSRAVRVSVLRGLRKLVDSQHAQPVLKKALPSISALLHDTDPGVREALADLLVAVSSSRSLHFWGVVPPEELLEVIAADSAPAVARKIARMLVPSYFPNAREGSARLGALLRSKPEAGLSFCRNLVARFYPSDPRVNKPHGASSTEFTASVPLEEILQFASDLAAHLLATVQRLGSPPAAQQPQQQPKRAKPAAARGKAGKKRAKKKAPEAADGAEEDGDAGEQQQAAVVAGADGGVGAGGAQADDDEDVVLQDASAETEEGWLAILEGLATIVQGLSAAVVHAEACGAAELAAALPAETLAQLLQAAEEQLCRPKAVKLALQIVAELHFTPGAQAVRATLFERLAAGALPGCKPASGEEREVMQLDGHRGPQGHDAGVLSEVLKTLATGTNGPKLVALLLAALGARQPLPLRKPVTSKKAAKAAAKERGNGGDEERDALEQLLGGSSGGGGGRIGLDGHGRSGEDGEDDMICVVCKRAQPADTMLLCDGCDAPCHTHCLRPALQEIPEDSWFCWRCESQLQAVSLPPAAAGRCVALLLQTEVGRELLCGHQDFGAIIQAMHQLAEAEAEELVRLAQAGASDEADSAPAAEDVPDEGAAASSSHDDRVTLLGDPWGALSRYCRAALHRALWFLQSPQQQQQQQLQPDDDGGEDEGPSVLPTPRRKRRGKRAAAEPDTTEKPARSGGAMEAEGGEVEEAGGGGGGGEEQSPLVGFCEIVPTLEFAVHVCGTLAELALAHPSCLSARLAVLQSSQGALRVLHVVHHTDILDVNGQYVATVSCMATAQAALAQALLAGLQQAQDDGGGAGGGGGVACCVSAHLHVLLGLAQQMHEAVRKLPAAAAEGDGGGEAGGAGGGGCGGAATPAPARDRTAEEEEEQGLGCEGVDGEPSASAAGSELVEAGGDMRQQQQQQQGLPPPDVALERLLVSLVTILGQTAVGPLVKGQVRAAVAFLMGELLASNREAASGGWLATLCKLTGEALSTDPRVAEELQEALQAQEADGAAEGGTAADREDGGAAGGAAPRAVRRRVKGGQDAAAAVTAAVNARQQAAAAKLADLLQRENPAIGTLALVLVRVCVARKVHGHAMLLLARLAGRTLAPAATQPQEAAGGLTALGATALLILCMAACPDAECAAAPQNGRQPAGRGRGTGASSGRCGALAKEAAAQAARAETEAAARALDVLRRAMGQQQKQRVAATGDPADEDGGDEEAAGLPSGLLQARLLAQQLVCGFAGAGAAAER